jgi:hypothetical protein
MIAETKTTNDESFFAEILAAIDGEQAAENSRAETVTTLQNSENKGATVAPLNLTAWLNSMIRAGISFEVGATDFLIHRESKSTGADSEFLKTEKAVILCTLQQGLLTKILFNHSPELLSAFSVNVKELESILIEAGAEDSAAYYEAVRTVTAEWFVNDLLSEV